MTVPLKGKMIKITKERPEIEKYLREGRRHVATRNGVEYVFELPEEERSGQAAPLTPRKIRKQKETEDG